MAPAILTTEQARERLGHIGRTKLHELLASGQLRSVKIGRRRMVLAADVDALLESSIVASTASDSETPLPA